MTELKLISQKNKNIFLIFLFASFGCKNQTQFSEQKIIVKGLIAAMTANEFNTLPDLLDSSTYKLESYNLKFQFDKGHYQLNRAKTDQEFRITPYEADDFRLCDIKVPLNKESMLTVEFIKLYPQKIFRFEVSGKGPPERWKM